MKTDNKFNNYLSIYSGKIMINTVRSMFTPIHREGYVFIFIGSVVTCLLFLLYQPLGWLCFVMTVYCAYFFRDPIRVIPLRDDLIISPADGRISMIKRVTPPPELGLGDEERVRISIFMNIFDCHIQRVPISGNITRIIYNKGLFFNAALDKASEKNERNSLIIKMKNGEQIGVVQIAGLVARRIVCFLKECDNIQVGERLGLIRFGSRVDLYLPVGKVPLIALGQRMIAGETILADLTSMEPSRLTYNA